MLGAVSIRGWERCSVSKGMRGQWLNELRQATDEYVRRRPPPPPPVKRLRPCMTRVYRPPYPTPPPPTRTTSPLAYLILDVGGLAPLEDLVLDVPHLAHDDIHLLQVDHPSVCRQVVSERCDHLFVADKKNPGVLRNI